MDLTDAVKRCDEKDLKNNFGRTPLFLAVATNNFGLVKELINSKCNHRVQDAFQKTVLHYAVEKDRIKIVKSLLDLSKSLKNVPAFLSIQDFHGSTALHYAARLSNPKCLYLLLKESSKMIIDLADKKLMTALHWACISGLPSNVNLLVKYEANILLKDINRRTSLHMCCLSVKPKANDCLEILLKATFVENALNMPDIDGASCLHLATSNMSIKALDMVETLVKHKNCRINLADNIGCTPIHWAVARDSRKLLKILMDNGANPTLRNNYGDTALHYAAKMNQSDALVMLLSESGITDLENNEGHTPLHLAAAMGSNLSVVELVSCKASLGQKDHEGRTPLHVAVINCRQNTVETFLKLPGVDIHARCNSGASALLLAARNGMTGIVERLLHASANLFDTDNKGQTALHQAVLGNHAFLAQILLEAGIDLECRDNNGSTPLLLAAVHSANDTLDMLLANKANVHAVDHKHRNALHYAVMDNNIKAVKALLNHGVLVNTIDRASPWRCTPLDLCANQDIRNLLLSRYAMVRSDLENWAAICIQAAFRGFIARKRPKNFYKWMFKSSGDRIFMDESGLKLIFPTKEENDITLGQLTAALQLPPLRRSVC